MTRLDNLIDEYKGKKNLKKRLKQTKCLRKKYSKSEIILIFLIIFLLGYCTYFIHKNKNSIKNRFSYVFF